MDDQRTSFANKFESKDFQMKLKSRIRWNYCYLLSFFLVSSQVSLSLANSPWKVKKIQENLSSVEGLGILYQQAIDVQRIDNPDYYAALMSLMTHILETNLKTEVSEVETSVNYIYTYIVMVSWMAFVHDTGVKLILNSKINKVGDEGNERRVLIYQMRPEIDHDNTVTQNPFLSIKEYITQNPFLSNTMPRYFWNQSNQSLKDSFQTVHTYLRRSFSNIVKQMYIANVTHCLKYLESSAYDNDSNYSIFLELNVLKSFFELLSSNHRPLFKAYNLAAIVIQKKNQDHQCKDRQTPEASDELRNKNQQNAEPDQSVKVNMLEAIRNCKASSRETYLLLPWQELIQRLEAESPDTDASQYDSPNPQCDRRKRFRERERERERENLAPEMKEEARCKLQKLTKDKKVTLKYIANKYSLAHSTLSKANRNLAAISEQMYYAISQVYNQHYPSEFND